MAAIPSNFDANEAQNLDDIEKQFAVKAVEHAQTYWMLLEKFGASKLKMTNIDDEIYEDLLETFPELKGDTSKAATLNEDEMKNKEGKAKWFKFAQRYENKVPDYNFGTLLRVKSNGEYDQDNTMFAFRVQFIAIEIYRNRHGLNDWIKK